MTTAFLNLQSLSSVNATFKIVIISNLSCVSAYINISNLSCISASLNYVNIYDVFLVLLML